MVDDWNHNILTDYALPPPCITLVVSYPDIGQRSYVCTPNQTQHADRMILPSSFTKILANIPLSTQESRNKLPKKSDFHDLHYQECI